MGNNTSGHVPASQAPPLWTQSLPRDAHRQKKYVGVQGTKVLPERIPGQRLKPTENGRSLQTQGTISTRKTNEISSPPSGYHPLLGNHHSSMTALNFPNTQFSPPELARDATPSHHIRFGPTPSKSFTSEPDLRGASPTSHVSLPTPSNTPHTLISESPTKGKIKSKKRYKAPLPPPPLQASVSFPLEGEYVPSCNMSFENQSSISSPISKGSKVKSRKIGLFRKKNDSRMSNYEAECPPIEIKLKENGRVEGRAKQRERSATPAPLQIISKKELKERARSLDNLQHEIKRSSPQGLTNSLHSLEIIGDSEISDSCQIIPNGNQRRYNSPISNRDLDSETFGRLEDREDQGAKLSSSFDRESRNHKRHSAVERRLYERQVVERRSEGILSSPVGDPKRFDILEKQSSSEYRRSSSPFEENQKGIKDEWDLAEEEWLEKKRKSENLHREIISVVKNLKKRSVSPELISKSETNFNSSSNRNVSTVHVNVDDNLPKENNDDLPKTFFFGMGPEEASKQSDLTQEKTALAKLNDQEEVRIVGTTVEYSRHSLRPKEKKRSLEREHWNRSLDYRDRSQSRSKEKELDGNGSKPEVKKKISREIDKFVATIEREKLKQKTSDELSNSISRKGDGGYHSRQNSGSFHLETEGSDDDNVIRMNLRPTLPRRQLELPRFSPNAAWRSLSLESTTRKEVHSDSTINEDVFSIGEEDQIHRYTRPTAPPRTSGEKSADSGISGDAGSPGPIQEFEPLTPEKIKTTTGPLAVSSPVASTKLDIKRAWTPAQDLDDNSFEENVDHSGKSNFHQEVSTMPKLTSRSNMFSKPSATLYSPDDEAFSDGSPIKLKHNSDDFHVNAQSLQRVKKKNTASHRNSGLERFDHPRDNNLHPEDNWRENWSLSRSIPNSLNTFDEPDCGEGLSHKASRSRSESRISLENQPTDSTTACGAGQRLATPGPIQNGTNGHIMYLPEYKSYLLRKEESKRRQTNDFFSHHPDNYKYLSDFYLSNPEDDRKTPSGEENSGELENPQWPSENPCSMDSTPKGNRFIVLNGKKSKKFTYQSTVRMMEKRKLEEKLSKEVEEKERRRLREMEAMLKVEEEFQMKREREKKRLKKQLQMYQEQHHHLQQQQQQQTGKPTDRQHQPPKDLFGSQQPPKNQDHFGRYDDSSDLEHPPYPSPSSPPPFVGHRQMTSYQSLPMELINNGATNRPHQNAGIFSGLKKWVKGKKERSGYLSDASSVTVTSGSRQEPDGAPASSPGRKNLDNIRAEIIAASRHRNGNVNPDKDIVPGRYFNGSPVPSIVSKESHLRTITPDSKRAVSPDSRKSVSSENYPLTQELPEMKQEQRQYREFRRFPRKALLLSGHPQQLKPNHKLAVSPASHNYRRDFCLGNVASSNMKLYQHDDIDVHSRHPNESRKSRHNPKRSSSADMIESDDFLTNSLRRKYASKNPKQTVPIPIPPRGDPRNYTPGSDRIHGPHVSKGIVSPHISPYTPNKGYRPINFSPTHGKILTVT